MITDPTSGEIVSYVPLYLQEGEESVPVTLRVAPETAEALLRATTDVAATILARIAPGGYQDIAVTPLDMSAYFGSFADVDFKVIAADPLPGITRVLLSAGIGRNAAAAWLG